MYAKNIEIGTESFLFDNEVVAENPTGEISTSNKEIQEEEQLSEYDTDSDDASSDETDEFNDDASDEYPTNSKAIDTNHPKELNFFGSLPKPRCRRSVNLSCKVLQSMFE